VDPQPPAWRVFDAPSGAQSQSAEPAGEPAGLSAASLRSPAVFAIAGAVVLGIAAVAVAVGGVPGSSGTVGDGRSDASANVDASDAGGDLARGGGLVVDVAGAVRRPGVYHLDPGARVADAIAAAGGLGPRVDAGRVAAELNLAAPLKDGDRIVVPSRDDATSPGGTPASAGGTPSHGALIDLNHATAEELDTLPGVGPVTAQKIIDSRAGAAFRTVDELRSRGLVGQKTFDRLKTLVTVG
jgi:competence protein ComEA